MSFGKTESNITADDSFLNKSDGTDSPEFTQNLLLETNQSFEDWLQDLSISPTPIESASSNAADYVPKARGEISFEGTLTVDGYLAGVVRSREGKLIVGENGEIDGDISVQLAMIHGSVRGDIYATEKVELGSTSRVIGDIETLELMIQPGAVFEGRCTFPQTAAEDQPELELTATT